MPPIFLFTGDRLTAPQTTKAVKYVKELNSEAVHPLTLYLAKQAPYDTDALSRDVNPESWWAAGKRLGFHDALCALLSFCLQRFATVRGWKDSSAH